MNSNLVAGGVVLAVILSGIAVFNGGQRGQDGKDGRDGVTVGAVPTLSSPLEVDGVRTYSYSATLRTGTSTVCSFRTPNATTTDVVISARIATVPYASTWEIATGASANATTTSLVTFSDGEGVYGSAGTVFAPNTFINVKVGTTSGTTVNANFTPTGGCDVVLQEL